MYIHIYMIETKLVQKFGNSGHVVLPKGYIGKRVRFITEPKRFEDIKSEVLETLKPYLEHVLGVYLYGSYARDEQTVHSDVDIFVVADTKLKIVNKFDGYSIVTVTPIELERTLKNNAVLILPIIKESKTIINQTLLEKYKDCKFTKVNTSFFIESSTQVLELNKKGLELNFDIGSLIYSLILRIRGLLIIKLILSNKLYSKYSLFLYLQNNGLDGYKVEELYNIHNKEKKGIKVKESDIITKEDIAKLLIMAERLLKEVSNLVK